jgi:2-amino-4-hydroxy-6-hydroxymethyldihydropteridine diphosphokinase
VWQSAPVGGPPGQDDYLNTVIRVETEQSARELLRTAQGVETALGRTRDVRWGPRTVDIDILTIDGVTNDTPELVVPHPRMLERAFVLLPLLELVRDPWLPDGRSVLTTAHPIGVAWPLAPPLLIPA